MSIDRVGRAGKLNKRILIEEQLLFADSAGQVFSGRKRDKATGRGYTSAGPTSKTPTASSRSSQAKK
jgi:hypothetical protein